MQKNQIFVKKFLGGQGDPDSRSGRPLNSNFLHLNIYTMLIFFAIL